MSHRNHYVDLVDEPIDVAPLQSRIADPDVGAHGWFYGVTRRKTVQNSEEKTTLSLSYEAHRVMAARELESLAQRAIEKFDLACIVIVHRIGEVPIGEASVVLGCSSAHRISTFQALQWVMDVLKKDVPIWKQETYVDGSTEWVHPTEPDRSSSNGTT